MKTNALFSNLDLIVKITKPRMLLLKKLELVSVKDLLWNIPQRIGDTFVSLPIVSLGNAGAIRITGKISKIKLASFRGKNYVTAQLCDPTGSLALVWFSQPYISKMFTNDETVICEGILSLDKTGKKKVMNPTLSKVNELIQGSSLFTNKEKQEQEIFQTCSVVYRETKGISSLFLKTIVRQLLEKEEIKKELQDPIPEHILKTLKLPNLITALHWLHFPQKKDHFLAAKKRFLFEYVWCIQLKRLFLQKTYQAQKAVKVAATFSDVLPIVQKLGFSLTNGQEEIIKTIISDISDNKPMTRLVQGDVGSGKTAIACLCAAAVLSHRDNAKKVEPLQIAFMAPTEILAQQLFEEVVKLLGRISMDILLVTGKKTYKFPSKVNPQTWTSVSKKQALSWLADGSVGIAVGTHALLSKTVQFRNLALVIIDEQHRFGTNQRMKLVQKDGHAPHYMSMSATPIPRTLALTIYGDLDISLLTDLPPNRKSIITKLVNIQHKKEWEKAIQEQLSLGHQVYILCAKISGNDKENEEDLFGNDDTTTTMRSVESESLELTKTFKKYTVGQLHGKMTSQKKEDIMQDFNDKKIDILVTTSVIEVGVNVPNATLIVIHNAERFGFAQLHQLRGRVARSSDQGYAFLVNGSKNEISRERLIDFISAKNGFEIAELDLTRRGAGDFSGLKQWGIPSMMMDALVNTALVSHARQSAKQTIENKKDFQQNHILQEMLQHMNIGSYLE
jgi:ATP-dependent DNA helicase RecG